MKTQNRGLRLWLINIILNSFFGQEISNNEDTGQIPAPEVISNYEDTGL